MNRRHLAIAIGAGCLEMAAYLVWRPAMSRWGTEGDEAVEPPPGHALVPEQRMQSTRAITSKTPPEQVWPWVVQMRPPASAEVRGSTVTTSRPHAVVAIKTLHSVAWFSIEACVRYVLYTGFIGRTDRRVAAAAAVVAGESVVFAANGFRCPLTRLAERYGAERGSVTDVFLPKWFAHNIPAIHAPLLPLMVYLHLRTRRRARESRST